MQVQISYDEALAVLAAHVESAGIKVKRHPGGRPMVHFDTDYDGLVELVRVEVEDGRRDCIYCHRSFLKSDLLDGSGNFIGWCVECDQVKVGQKFPRREV